MGCLHVQEICFTVVWFLSKRICPILPASKTTHAFLNRVQGAAKKMIDFRMFPDATTELRLWQLSNPQNQKECQSVTVCMAEMSANAETHQPQQQLPATRVDTEQEDPLTSNAEPLGISVQETAANIPYVDDKAAQQDALGVCAYLTKTNSHDSTHYISGSPLWLIDLSDSSSLLNIISSLLLLFICLAPVVLLGNVNRLWQQVSF